MVGAWSLFYNSIREENCSRDSTVGKPITLWYGRSGDRIPAAARGFSLIQKVQIGYGALFAGGACWPLSYLWVEIK